MIANDRRRCTQSAPTFSLLENWSDLRALFWSLFSVLVKIICQQMIVNWTCWNEMCIHLFIGWINLLTFSGCHASCLHKTIYRSGREFLEADDPIRQDASFPDGGGIESGTPKLRNYRRETQLTALNGMLIEKARNAPARSADKRWVNYAVCRSPFELLLNSNYRSY